MVALVEGKAEGRGVRLKQHVRDRDFALEIGTCAAPRPRVFMVADVVPGPAVERARLDRRDVIRRQIVAKQIAFIGGAEHGASSWLDRKP